MRYTLVVLVCLVVACAGPVAAQEQCAVCKLERVANPFPPHWVDDFLFGLAHPLQLYSVKPGERMPSFMPWDSFWWDGVYKPDESIDVDAVWGSPELPQRALDMKDLPDAGEAYTAVKGMINAGILVGYPGDTVRASDLAERRELALVLRRLQVVIYAADKPNAVCPGHLAQVTPKLSGFVPMFAPATRQELVQGLARVLLRTRAGAELAGPPVYPAARPTRRSSDIAWRVLDGFGCMVDRSWVESGEPITRGELAAKAHLALYTVLRQCGRLKIRETGGRGRLTEGGITLPSPPAAKTAP